MEVGGLCIVVVLSRSWCTVKWMFNPSGFRTEKGRAPHPLHSEYSPDTYMCTVERERERGGEKEREREREIYIYIYIYIYIHIVYIVGTPARLPAGEGSKTLARHSHSELDLDCKDPPAVLNRKCSQGTESHGKRIP